MSELVRKLPLDQEIKAVLLGKASPLRPLYQLMLARESGEWQVVAEQASRLQLRDTEVADAYWQAMQWAREVCAR
jgi:c-di-GMP-related signal transduction protein